jgi:hypothetical protein
MGVATSDHGACGVHVREVRIISFVFSTENFELSVVVVLAPDIRPLIA